MNERIQMTTITLSNENICTVQELDAKMVYNGREQGLL